MKTFLIRSAIFFVTAAALTVGVFFFISAYQASHSSPEDMIKEAVGGVVRETEQPSGAMAEKIKEKIPESGIPLASLPLTESHKKMLVAVNIDTETFVLTEAMIICAGGKIGEGRMEEILAGNAPSILEITKFIPCLGA